MSRRVSRLSVMVGVLLLGATGCVKSHRPTADEAYSALKDAYADGTAPADRVALAEEFLAAYPDSDRTAAVLDLAAYDLKEGLGDLARARSLAESTLARTTDPEARFEMGLTLWDVTQAQGQPLDLRLVARELEGRRPLRFGELQSLVEAAVKSAEWTLADEWSKAALALATPEAYRSENPDTTASDEEVAERTRRRLAQAAAYQAWAAFNLGRTEEAMAAFAAAREVTTLNFVGVPQTPLYRFWGEAALRQGDLVRAEELLAPDAVMAGDEHALALLRRIWVERTGDEAGFDDSLWSTRQRLARVATDFSLPTYGGEQVSLLASHPDKVVMLAFWFPT